MHIPSLAIVLSARQSILQTLNTTHKQISSVISTLPNIYNLGHKLGLIVPSVLLLYMDCIASMLLRASLVSLLELDRTLLQA